MLSLTGISGFTIFKQQPKIAIAAAADLKFAMDSIVTAFKAENAGVDIEVNYGLSGKFFEQISNDAPFDIFFSADVDYPNKLKEEGLTAGPVKAYGIGQIVLWSKKTDPNIQQMKTLLNTDIKKIAIANPDHAPCGKRGKESLEYYKLFDAAQDKLVYGENISQTAQFVMTGAVDIGIVALSLAVSPSMKNQGGKYYLIPEQSHTPLEQAYVLLKHSSGNAMVARFYNFISFPKAIRILKYFGFSQKAK
jgi:molybdate transport system substrate-binding protein